MAAIVCEFFWLYDKRPFQFCLFENQDILSHENELSRIKAKISEASELLSPFEFFIQKAISAQSI
jgi:hypothetical protein